jgi:hypothetical protein
VKEALKQLEAGTEEKETSATLLQKKIYKNVQGEINLSGILVNDSFVLFVQHR